MNGWETNLANTPLLFAGLFAIAEGGSGGGGGAGLLEAAVGGATLLLLVSLRGTCE